jgi:predicted nucleic acid-binding protein
MFLDSNVLIHAFLDARGGQAEVCKRLWRKVIAGEQRATTSALVAEEVLHFFLEKKGKALAMRVLRNVLENKNMAILPVDERALSLVLEFVNAGLDSADALHAAVMKANSETTICSYDKGFDKAPGIRRKEP